MHILSIELGQKLFSLSQRTLACTAHSSSKDSREKKHSAKEKKIPHVSESKKDSHWIFRAREFPSVVVVVGPV